VKQVILRIEVKKRHKSLSSKFFPEKYMSEQKRSKGVIKALSFFGESGQL
jgi:hypothetical protein